MTQLQRLRYVVMSVIYIAGVGGFGGMLTYAGYKFFMEGGNAVAEPDPTNLFFLLAVTFWTSVVGILQRYRVIHSQERFTRLQHLPETYKPPMMDFLLHAYFSFFMMLPFAIGGILSWLTGK